MVHEIGAVRAVASLDAAGIGVGVSQARSHLKVLRGGFQTVSRETVREVQRMADGVANSTSKIATSIQSQIDAMTGVDRIARNTSASTRAWVANLERQAKSFDQLRASVDPLYASSKRYESAVEQVNKAVRAGIVSQTEANKVLQMASQQYLGAATGVDKAAKATGGLAKNLTPEQQNNARIFAFQLNQIGQQGAVTGDYLGAATVQAADMLAVFGVAGIVMGGVVTVAGSVAKGFFESANGAKDAADATQKLTDVVLAYRDASDRTRQTNRALIDQYGLHAEAARETLNAVAGLAELDALDRLRGTVSSFSSEFGHMSQRMEYWVERVEMGGYAGEKAVAKLKKEFGLSRDGAVKLMVAMDQLSNSSGPKEVAKSARGIQQALVAVYGETRKIPTELAAMARMAAESHLSASELLHVISLTSGEVDQLEDGLSRAAQEALKLAGVDIASGISSAAKGAANLAASLGVSLEAAYNIKNLQSSLEYSGRGGDPRKSADASYQMELGYKSVDEVIKELTRSTKKAGEAASRTSKNSLAGLRQEIAQRKHLLTLSGAARDEYEAQIKVTQRLGKEVSKLSKAQIKGLADQMVSLDRAEEAMQRMVTLQGNWSDQITRTAFEGGKMSDTIKSMLRDIAMQFARSKIVLPVVASVTSVLGLNQGVLGSSGRAVAGGATGGGGGASSLLASALPSVFGASGLMAGVGAGAAASLGLGGYASAGIFNVGANAALASAATGAGALATTLGAAVPVIGLAVAAFSFFSSKTKLLDQGIRVTVDEMDTLVESFRRVQKSRFWGLSKKTREYYDTLADDAAAPIKAAISQLQAGIFTAASTLGQGAEIWDGFTAQFKVSTKGMSEEEAQKAVQDALGGFSDQMAALVPGLQGVMRTGEGANDALMRISTSLMSVNDVLNLLGHGAYEASVKGGNLASQLSDLFGGNDQMRAVANGYFTAFYSEAERLEIQTRRATAALADMGVSMPQSRAQFRALVDGLDLTRESGRDLYARLLSMSGAIDQIFTGQDSAIRQVTDQWLGVSDGLRALLGDLNASQSLSGRSAAEAHRVNENRLNTAMRMAQGGDVQAAADIPALARAYLGTARQTSATGVEYQGAVARIRSQVTHLNSMAAGYGGGSYAVTPQPLPSPAGPRSGDNARLEAEMRGLRAQNEDMQQIMMNIARTNDRIMKLARRREDREAASDS